ncbi:PD-(D/E)XK nuclease domain-containing protein [Streptomyces gelaticus]
MLFQVKSRRVHEMARRDHFANALIPHGHQQNWDLIGKVIKEMERITSQWPDAETEVTVEGKNDLWGRYDSLIDARVGLGEDFRDVVRVDISRRSGDFDDVDRYLSVTLDKRKSETSWVYASGPVKRVCEDLVRRLQSYILEVVNHPQAPAVAAHPAGRKGVPGLDELAETLARFPGFLRSLTSSKEPNVKPPRVEKEKDLQVLVGACLRLIYNDVRPEDYISEYAGGRSRVDFFLPEVGIVVETKMIRESLSDRRVGEELLIDFGRYSSRPDCCGILAVIYDPKMILENPAGLEFDLSRSTSATRVIVVR